VLAGAVGGLALYTGTQLAGLWAFALWGGLVGLVAGVIMYGHRRSVQLTDITMSVPQVGQLHFAVTRESQFVAWKLFVELVTRISTQPLPEHAGRLRSALNSLHGLLAFTRELLRENPPSRQTGSTPTVEQLAIAMLNVELRPFLTGWHRLLSEWQAAHPVAGERDWPQAERCRTELAAVQQRLREYALSFGELAGVPNAKQIVAGSLLNQ
jgi:hypothetical protein